MPKCVTRTTSCPKCCRAAGRRTLRLEQGPGHRERARRRKSSVQERPMILDTSTALDKPHPCSMGRSGTDLCDDGRIRQARQGIANPSRSRRESLRRVSQLALSAMRSGVKGLRRFGTAMTSPQIKPATIASPSSRARASRPRMTGTILERRVRLGTIGLHDPVLEQHAEKRNQFFADAALQVAPNTAPA